MTGASISLNSKVDDHPFSVFRLDAESPAGARRRGGVIVLHDVHGVDGHVRHECERWSKLGFEAWAPSLFDRCEPGFVGEPGPDGLHEGFRYMQATRAQDAVADIETCLDGLAPRGPVFVVGYGYGGSLAYVAACRLEDLAAASSAYGAMVLNHAGEPPRCPTICHFATRDDATPEETVQAFAARRPEVEVHLYDASHGFNDEGTRAHDLKAAKLARQRTLALFEANGAAP